MLVLSTQKSSNYSQPEKEREGKNAKIKIKRLKPTTHTRVHIRMISVMQLKNFYFAFHGYTDFRESF